MAAKDWVDRFLDKEDEEKSPKKYALGKFLKDEIKTEDDAETLHSLLNRIKEGK